MAWVRREEAPLTLKPRFFSAMEVGTGPFRRGLVTAVNHLSFGGWSLRDLVSVKARYQDSQNLLAHYNLGLIEQTASHLELAERHYQRALATDPNVVPALFNLALVEEASGDLDNAVDLYQRILKVDPSQAAAISIWDCCWQTRWA
jgi:tetratricopeptide (TPR) repeat protein